MRTTSVCGTVSCLISTGAILAFGENVYAATDDVKLEEVIVTASKREENLQVVPTAISVVDAANLQNLGTSSLTDVAKLVPGLQVVVTNAASNNYYSIRGATESDFAEHQESPVAVYMDGVYLSQAAGTAALLFDMARVEVLRGPQGTLFGRNATAGLVHYISNSPSERLTGYAQIRFGDDNERTAEAAISGPILPNLLARLSVGADMSDPWLKNTIAKDPYKVNSRAARLQFSSKAGDNFAGTLNLHAIDVDVDRAGFYEATNVYPDPSNHGGAAFLPPDLNWWGTCPGCDQFGYRNPSSYDYYTGANDLIGYLHNKVSGATLTLKYHFADLNLTSISDSTRFEKQDAEDVDGRPVLEGNYWPSLETDQWSQEIRLDNGADGRLRWVAGLYYLKIDGHYLFDAGFPGNFGIQNDYSLESKSAAGFAQADYDLFPRLTLTLGFRWSEERKELNYTNSTLAGSLPGAPVDTSLPITVINASTVGDAARLSKGDWSARAALAYHFTTDLMAYISWNRGIKPGGFNVPYVPYTSLERYRYDEEVLTATEIGIKSEFLGGQARVNADVFYYDYDGYQAFNTIGFENFLTNHQAEMYGGEIELAWRPAHGLNLRSGVALLSTKVKNFQVSDGTYLMRQSAHSPKWSITGGVDYTLPLQMSGSLTASTDVNYRSMLYYSLENEPASKQDPLWLQSLGLKYTSRQGHYSTRAFVDNLFNKKYPLYSINNAGAGYGSFLPAKPRVIGLQLTYSF